MSSTAFRLQEDGERAERTDRAVRRSLVVRKLLLKPVFEDHRRLIRRLSVRRQLLRDPVRLTPAVDRRDRGRIADHLALNHALHLPLTPGLTERWVGRGTDGEVRRIGLRERGQDGGIGRRLRRRHRSVDLRVGAIGIPGAGTIGISVAAAEREPGELLEHGLAWVGGRAQHVGIECRRRECAISKCDGERRTKREVLREHHTAAAGEGDGKHGTRQPADGDGASGQRKIARERCEIANLCGADRSPIAAQGRREQIARHVHRRTPRRRDHALRCLPAESIEELEHADTEIVHVRVADLQHRCLVLAEVEWCELLIPDEPDVDRLRLVEGPALPVEGAARGDPGHRGERHRNGDQSCSR